ncbi:MAG: hypothetical protein IPG99_07525 [Ignavibacteria bacterium]|nr:hypothetical protein [Ignavibacteria bacterium]
MASVKAINTGSTASPIGMSGQNSTGNIYNNTIKEVSSANISSTAVRPIGIQASGLTSR